MARFEVDGLEKLTLDLEELAKFPAAAQDRMLNAGADVLVKRQRERAEDYGVEDTGLVINSIKKTGCKVGKDGRSISVYPQGARTRNGITTQNAEIAFVAEYGRPGASGHGRIAPRPFIRDANEDAADEVVEAMSLVYDEETKKLGL